MYSYLQNSDFTSEVNELQKQFFCKASNSIHVKRAVYRFEKDERKVVNCLTKLRARINQECVILD